MAQRFRKKSSEIEGVQWIGSNVAEVRDWAGENVTWQPDGGLSISTLDGTLWVRPDAWVLRDGSGGFSAVSPDVFAEFYEPVDGE